MPPQLEDCLTIDVRSGRGGGLIPLPFDPVTPRPARFGYFTCTVKHPGMVIWITPP